jgi:transaldolase
MQAIVRSSDAPTRILVASIRSVDDIAGLVADGLDTFTFSPAIAEQLFSDSLTLQAADTFEEHAAATQIRG